MVVRMAVLFFFLNMGLLYGFGDASLFHMRFVKLPGIENRIGVDDLDFFIQQLKTRTNVEPVSRLDFVDVKSGKFFTQPFVIIYGCNSFPPFDSDVITRLRRFLQSGGLILVDSCDSEGVTDFNREIKEELLKVLPGRKWEKLPSDHVIYQTFYLLDAPTGRVERYPYLEGINSWGRTVVIFSGNDLMGCLRQDAFGNFFETLEPGWSMQREFCIRTMINIVFYALTGSYKKDQLHVPYILERRQKKGFYQDWTRQMMNDVKKRKEKFKQLQQRRRGKK